MFLKTLMHRITIVVQTKAHLECDTKRLFVGKGLHGFEVSSRFERAALSGKIRDVYLPSC